MPLCLDLCSGLGGFSQAFVDAGWEVIHVDNNPKFAPEVCADVRDLVTDAWFLSLKPEVILASPPCQRFSIANAHHWVNGLGESLRVAAACFELIERLRPRFFCLENPRGRLRWFAGKPTSSVRLKNYGYETAKMTDLWHNLGLAQVGAEQPRDGGHHYFPFRYDRRQPKKNRWSDHTTSEERAKIPHALSQAVLDAVT